MRIVNLEYNETNNTFAISEENLESTAPPCRQPLQELLAKLNSLGLKQGIKRRLLLGVIAGIIFIASFFLLIISFYFLILSAFSLLCLILVILNTQRFMKTINAKISELIGEIQPRFSEWYTFSEIGKIRLKGKRLNTNQVFLDLQPATNTRPDGQNPIIPDQIPIYTYQQSAPGRSKEKPNSQTELLIIPEEQFESVEIGRLTSKNPPTNKKGTEEDRDPRVAVIKDEHGSVNKNFEIIETMEDYYATNQRLDHSDGQAPDDVYSIPQRIVQNK
jgi:hypothetical protein